MKRSIWRKREGAILESVEEYIASTYGQHYSSRGATVLDVWESMGSLSTTSRDTAIKYLMRYGRKNGSNVVDLMKAIHYIVLMIYAHQVLEDEEEAKTGGG